MCLTSFKYTNTIHSEPWSPCWGTGNGSSVITALIHWLTIIAGFWFIRLSFTLNCWRVNLLHAYQVQHTKKSITSGSNQSDKLNIKIKFVFFPRFLILRFFWYEKKQIIFLVSESQTNNKINVCFWFRFPNWILKERMRHWFSSPPLFIFWIIMPWTDRVCVSNTDTATEIEGFPLRQRGCQHSSPWISSPQWFKYTVHSVSFSLCAPSSTHAHTYTHTLTHVPLRSHIQTVRWRFSAVCFGFSLCCFLLSGEQMIEGTGGRRRRRRWDSCLPIDDVE